MIVSVNFIFLQAYEWLFSNIIIILYTHTPNVLHKANNIDEALGIYNGEILFGDRTGDPLAYKYTWTTYTDGSLSTIYSRFGKQQVTNSGNSESMGHRNIVNAPAMSVMRYSVTDDTGTEVGSCLVGPVFDVAKGELNSIDSVSQRFFRRVDCNNVGCEIPFTNTYRRCEDGYKPTLYQPNNIYEGQRHKCELPPPPAPRL
jgi:hypothetical protein